MRAWPSDAMGRGKTEEEKRRGGGKSKTM